VAPVSETLYVDIFRSSRGVDDWTFRRSLRSERCTQVDGAYEYAGQAGSSPTRWLLLPAATPFRVEGGNACRGSCSFGGEPLDGPRLNLVELRVLEARADSRRRPSEWSAEPDACA